MVADGMGGHKSGDKASKLVIDAACHAFAPPKDAESAQVAAILHEAVCKAARDVFLASMSSITLHGMGTTLSAMVIADGMAHICHIGDSRIYCLQEGRLKQMTNDHSLVMEQVQAGLMSQEEARTSSFRNIITRAIGHKEVINPDQFSHPTKIGDLFLLCTDGLNNMLSDQEIAEILSKHPPQEALRLLITTANRNGGDDNITAILVGVA